MEISIPAVPATIASGASNTTKEFESRKAIEESILTFLNDSNANVIGIWGLGGVGKTTTAERIIDLVRGENLFDEFFKVVVGQHGTTAKIQGDMADQLGVSLIDADLSSRAYVLRTRLLIKNKILLVIDDVREKLEFDNFGISWDNCKILYTSREEGVFDGIDGGLRVIELGVLPKEDAWDLFRENAGDCLEDPSVQSLAELVSEECGGLPLSLTIVAAALKDERSGDTWDDALRDLKSSNPADLPEVLEEVYTKLKLSYDKLSEHSKSILLLCSMFPEDYDIPIEQLGLFSIGLGMFEEVGSLKEWKNKVHTLTKSLKSYSLLLDGKDEDHVKMHDVVRDMVSYVAASPEEQKFMKELSDCTDLLKEKSNDDCIWISLVSQGMDFEFPLGLNFPNLRLLMMKGVNFLADENLESPDLFFDGMKELNALSLWGGTIQSLPQSMEALENLKTLQLNYCGVESISIVGKLKNLHVLICRMCCGITELTSELKNLSLLRCLEMIDCGSLSKIAPGVISSFTRLEELRMIDSFNQWDEEIEDEKNASLTELEFLTNLSCLHISVTNLDLLTTEFKFPPKVDKFHISFLTTSNSYYFRESFAAQLKPYAGCDKVVEVKLDTMNALANWICLLVSGTEGLCLQGISSELSRSSTPISVENIGCLQQLSTSFPNLKELLINELNSLTHLWSPYHTQFTPINLRSIKVYFCWNIQSVFPLSLVISLPLLESLHIEDCEGVQEIFVNDGEYNDVVLPKLKDLGIVGLPKLTSFTNEGVQSIKFHHLTSLVVLSCPKLKTFAPNTQGNNDIFFNGEIAPSKLNKLEVGWMQGLTHLWMSPYQNQLTCLQSLEISDCNDIKYCFLSACESIISQLEQLQIESCDEIQEIFSIDDSEKEEGAQKCFFRKLKKLRLSKLSNLTTFHSGVQILEFPSLTELYIDGCSGLTNFTADGFFNQMVEFGKLGNVTVKNCANLKNGFLSSSALQLNSLEISDCQEIQEIFEEDDDTGDDNRLIFAKFDDLQLDNLPSLATFNKGFHSLEFPQLRSIRIWSCPLLQIDEFSKEKVTFKKIESVSISDCANLEDELSSSALQVDY